MDLDVDVAAVGACVLVAEAPTLGPAVGGLRVPSSRLCSRGRGRGGGSCQALSFAFPLVGDFVTFDVGFAALARECSLSKYLAVRVRVRDSLFVFEAVGGGVNDVADF